MDTVDKATQLLEAQERLVLEARGGSFCDRREIEVSSFTACLSHIDTLASFGSLEVEEYKNLENIINGAITRARERAPFSRMPGFGSIDLLPGETLPSHFMADDIGRFAGKTDPED